MDRSLEDEAEEEAEVEPAERDPTGRYSRFEQVLGRGAFKTGACFWSPSNTLTGARI